MSNPTKTPNKDCHCPKVKHYHGTARNYDAHGCRCLPCSADRSNTRSQERKQKAYGRHKPKRVPSQPARDHIARLREQGMSIRAISEQSGLSKSVIGRILYGRTSQNLPPAKYIDGTTAEAILATQFRHSLKALVDATGTKRRIQALARIGYSVNEQARLMGRDPANLSHTLHVDETWASTRYAVAELYDKLQNRPRNGTSKGERISINRTRSYARQNGWLPPAAWDEDRMDDPEHKGYPEAVAA